MKHWAANFLLQGPLDCFSMASPHSIQSFRRAFKRQTQPLKNPTVGNQLPLSAVPSPCCPLFLLLLPRRTRHIQREVSSEAFGREHRHQLAKSQGKPAPIDKVPFFVSKSLLKSLPYAFSSVQFLCCPMLLPHAKCL